MKQGKKKPVSWFWRKYHKWLGIVLSFFLLFFALSGIVLNHRKLFAPADVSRSVLPSVYRYHNWNNAAVKGTEVVTSDSILIYGNIGVWLTQGSFRSFKDLNQGFPSGADHRKIHRVLDLPGLGIFAATLFGLHHFDHAQGAWVRVPLPPGEEEIMDLAGRGDTLLALTRSGLIRLPGGRDPERVELPPPLDHDHRVSLFKTFWTIHSGEIFGIPGQLLVDAAGLVFIFLSLTGILYFFIPGLIRRRKARSAGFGRLRGLRRWSLRWHNKIGWMTLPILLVTASTGMFLRPPLLIPIAGAYVPPIPCTLLDGSNAWEDQLRRIIFDHERGRYMVATIKGVYEVMPGLDQPPVRIPGAPPISVMGVNVFEAPAPGWLLVGSFEGLFLWHPESGYIHDYIRDRQYERRVPDGNPVGEFLVAGFSRDLNGIEVVFDYDRGSLVLGSMDYLPAMPPEIRDQPISLWNLALEVHTARIYQVLIGPFYLLLIPLIGLFTLFILISGFIVWYRHHRRRPPQVGMSQGK